jgi:Sigma-54 interaction domain
MPIAHMSRLNETFVTRREDRRLTELVAMLRRSRPNVLVVGPSTDADRTFDVMYPYLRTPIVPWAPRNVRELPGGMFRTLLVRDIDALTASQQENLVALICRLGADLQIVSIAKAPIFPLVEQGRFLDRLYYQLNVVYLDLTDAHAA